jgi:hypothetical protein
MAGYVETHPEGSFRRYRSERNGGAVLWGSLEEQIAEATADNLRYSSGLDHQPMDLWTWAQDCGHENPDDLLDEDRYADVETLIDAWMARNCAGLTSWNGSKDWEMHGHLYYRNRQRAVANIPLAFEYYQKLEAYEELHVGAVCKHPDSYMGTTCRACTDGDDDFGYEPSGCRRQENAKENQDMFWYEYGRGTDG